MGAAFLKFLRVCRELYQRVPFLPLRMAIGGLFVGIIAIQYPDVWGNGYVVASHFIQHPIGSKALLEIFLAKLIATGMTVGSGAVGGVITPTLFLGASLGSLLGKFLQEAGLGPEHLPIGIFALVGMGSIFSATTRSPLLAIVMILEISLNYSIMPALMLGCAVSTLVSRRLHPTSVYTESQKLRGRDKEESRLGAVAEQTIGDLMRAPVRPVRENTRLPQIAERFLGCQNNFLPVVDAQSRLVGVVALLDLKEYLWAGPEMNAVIAGDVMRAIPPVLQPGSGLMAALPILLASEQRNVPVVNTMEEKILIGSVVRAEALAVLSEAIAAGSSAESGKEHQDSTSALV
jgi:CIC family chloride channel protein